MRRSLRSAARASTSLGRWPSPRMPGPLSQWHPKCKLVAVSFTGFNHVDLEACKKRGISVVNVPAYSTDSVAELSVGLALAVYREIPAGERTLRDGGWVHSAGGMEIRDKVVGIVGLGDIGLRTAELFKAFGPKEILGWSRRPKPAFDSLGKQVPIEELFEKADIVSLHVALNAETQGIINRSLMERLRPESVLINVARGGVCDQPALADLLSKKRFRAGLESPASGNSCLPLQASMLCFFVLFVCFFLFFLWRGGCGFRENQHFEDKFEDCNYNPGNASEPSLRNRDSGFQTCEVDGLCHFEKSISPTAQ
ncbi:unnamed protein product [Effrenium voratum]|nr:unnamed protein product [Effrenium voratum]